MKLSDSVMKPVEDKVIAQAVLSLTMDLTLWRLPWLPRSSEMEVGRRADRVQIKHKFV